MQPTKQDNALEQAIQILTADHDKVRLLFREYKKLMDLDADASQRGPVAAKICQELTAHAELEEQIFYPAARKAISEDAEECMDHADVEHQSLKRLIADIEGSHPDDEHFDANVHVLQEYVAHHVEEEENDMFEELRHAEPKMDSVLKKMQEAVSKRTEKPSPFKDKSPKNAGDARQSKAAARKQVRTSGSQKKPAAADK
ncbi:hemerythrin domain-containing protein [Diaphorobacter sp.]|uniref:hemerythrin domain-containing protein n=1 Tax=Diaphorobacter sp. TaxID=1934310 RepID=UPI0028A725B4|nr:hemerythrin domain-containing protein [Diaphorobacter sp.]